MMSDVILNDLQIISFGLYNEEKNKQEIYGITIDRVREIRLLETITIIPNSPSFVRGVMNLRGNIIPILDLKQKLGFSCPHKISPKVRILVAEINGKLVGLLVDGVEQIMKIPFSDIESNLSGGLESISHIMGIAKNAEKLIVLLDVEKLMSTSLASNQLEI